MTTCADTFTGRRGIDQRFARDGSYCVPLAYLAYTLDPINDVLLVLLVWDVYHKQGKQTPRLHDTCAETFTGRRGIDQRFARDGSSCVPLAYPPYTFDPINDVLLVLLVWDVCHKQGRQTPRLHDQSNQRNAYGV